MSHTIYTTNAIVLQRVATGEADVTLWLLTAELGLLVARAQGARKGLAKMRGYLQLFSVLRISLVRGKYVWRVTGTESIQGDSSDTLHLQGETLSAFARIAAFVRRMTLMDTQINLELFDIVKTARRDLLVENVDAERIEVETIAKVLVSLGYIEVGIILKIENKEMEHGELAQVVNNAIAESHL